MYSPFWTFMILCVICATVCRIVAIKVAHRDARSHGEGDTRLMQELHRDLGRMQDRIETLETLLIERARDKDREGQWEKV